MRALPGQIAAEGPGRTYANNPVGLHLREVIAEQRNRDPAGGRRHAVDVDLSAEGRERAERLAQAIKKYKPHEIFSTDYKRTRQTAEPIAKLRGKEIQIYDPQKQADLIPKILASTTDHYLIVGHSNTIPALANLLAKKDIFKQLQDAEYGVIWVIRIKKGLVSKVEVIPY